MEFTQYTCPVCNRQFENGDDVVVCPDCGAPHHRSCYEQTNRCFYYDRHAQGFDFGHSDSDNENGAEDNLHVIHCPKCGKENEKTAFFCGGCGFPLHDEDRQPQENAAGQSNRQQNPQGMPFGFGTSGAAAFDPLAGMNSEEDIADNVKVGEMAKFIGKSTPYYLMVFHRIKQFGSGRFSFSAFLFSGAFFVYRKMYVLGIILSLLMIGVTVGSTALMMSNPWMLTTEYADMLANFNNGEFGAGELGVLAASAGFNVLRFGIMLFSGFSANRFYYRHCVKRIHQIKAAHRDGDLNKTLETQGGVNLPMAISLFASFAVIHELCNIYLITQF